MDIQIIVLMVLVAAAGWLILTYNKLIVFKNRVKEAWSDIKVQLQRRYNLIPNLVETVKGYATHEKEVFERVTKARTMAMGAENIKEKAQAENALSNTLKSLFAVAENYPQLRTSENFLALQKDLTDTEDKIQAARRFYNGLVRDLNNQVEKFPVNLIAGTLGFKQADFFETSSEEAEKPVNVKF